MKKIIITITPTGLIVDAEGVALMAINPPETISQGFFLETLKQETFFCLN
jgi:hypothetical protein